MLSNWRRTTKKPDLVKGQTFALILIAINQKQIHEVRGSMEQNKVSATAINCREGWGKNHPVWPFLPM